MTSFVGAKIDKPFEKGSSKPNYEETVEQKVAKCITSDLKFKNGNSVLDVRSISDKHNIKIDKDFFKDSTNYIWNHSFKGDATISINDDNGYSSYTYQISGHVNIEDNDCKEIYNIVNIEKRL